MKLTARIHTAVYRLTRGRLGGSIDGLDVLLLTTRGRKTGLERTSPLPYFCVGPNDLMLVASYGGNDRNPAWYANLRAQPEVTVQLRGRSAKYRARVLEGAEREGAWRSLVAEHPRYAEYQSRTEREIPLVTLAGAAALLP